MIKRRKHKKMGLREETRVRCPGHLKWIRGHVCLISGTTSLLQSGETHWLLVHQCKGTIEAAHVRTNTDGGTGLKPGDNWIVPLCSKAHAEQHKIGERSFEDRYMVDLKSEAKKLWNKSPHRVKYEQRRKG